jgi:hypothetical protein
MPSTLKKVNNSMELSSKHVMSVLREEESKLAAA